jgi:hypothetical protein
MQMSGSSPSAFSVEVSPSEVDAGADLKVKLSCVPPADLRGKTLLIKDDEAALVDGVEIARSEEGGDDALELLVKAPVKPGRHSWQAVCAAAGSSRTAPEGVVTFSFTVNPHATRIVIWGAPSAVECGQKFSAKLGVKCSCACRPDGWVIEVRDHGKRTLATVRPGDAPWPGTDALYYADVELTAPDAEGLYEWEGRLPATALDSAHSECSATFGVRVVPAADCRLTVVAVDIESQAPIMGAKVVVHPYRTSTDERGVAEISVPKGKFRLFVSGRNYLPFRSDGEATKDVTIRAELAADVGPSDAEVWS